MNKLINSTIFKAMEAWAPRNIAYDWDNVGLQIGSYDKKVSNVMVTLDVLESVVDEAIEQNIDLIIAHHPIIFKPLKRIDLDTPKGRILQKLINHNITVYISHTNLDIAEGGVNDMLADLLNLKERRPLVDTKHKNLYKLAVYVPITHQEVVRDALSEAGAGHIGNYSHCMFQTEGKGTFKPLEGSEPFSGTVNEVAFVDEVKMETVVKEADLSSVITALLKAHPYDEVAHDIFPMVNKGESFGLGRIGKLDKEMSLAHFVEYVKERLNVKNVRVIGDMKRYITRVALLGGSGEKYIHAAKQMGADVYITGDMTFHVAQEADDLGLSVIDPGHYIEKVMKLVTADYLRRYFGEQLDVSVSKVRTEPFQFL